MCNTTTAGNELGLTDANHVCACDTGAHAEATTPSAEAGIREHYLVEGMTCSHCVASVTEEISALDGVEGVSVDLKVGGASRVVVISSAPVSPESIRAAVTEAGYALIAG